ncbi:MAG TPA: hypothetical protein PKA33_18145, partial [Amaricoccus sp.]|uniref:hypothetical protein n=1 Tax=Amaricoccus sp. TaxID=1872485 RepID=UPI002D0D0692
MIAAAGACRRRRPHGKPSDLLNRRRVIRHPGESIRYECRPIDSARRHRSRPGAATFGGVPQRDMGVVARKRLKQGDSAG